MVQKMGSKITFVIKNGWKMSMFNMIHRQHMVKKHGKTSTMMVEHQLYGIQMYSILWSKAIRKAQNLNDTAKSESNILYHHVSDNFNSNFYSILSISIMKRLGVPLPLSVCLFPGLRSLRSLRLRRARRPRWWHEDRQQRPQVGEGHVGLVGAIEIGEVHQPGAGPRNLRNPRDSWGSWPRLNLDPDRTQKSGHGCDSKL